MGRPPLVATHVPGLRTLATAGQLISAVALFGILNRNSLTAAALGIVAALALAASARALGRLDGRRP